MFGAVAVEESQQEAGAAEGVIAELGLSLSGEQHVSGLEVVVHEAVVVNVAESVAYLDGDDEHFLEVVGAISDVPLEVGPVDEFLNQDFALVAGDEIEDLDDIRVVEF